MFTKTIFEEIGYYVTTTIRISLMGITHRVMC